MQKVNIHHYDPASLVGFYIKSDIIGLDDVMNSTMEELMNKILEKLHPYKISKGKDGRWTTYVVDHERPNDRRLIKKKSKTELLNFLLLHYQIGEDKSKLTFSELYTEWVDYKNQFVSVNNRKKSISPSTIKRYAREYDSYIANTALANCTIGAVTTPLLTEMILKIIKDNEMLEKCASNLIGYIHCAFEYACSCEYIPKDPSAHLDRRLLLAMCTFKPPAQDEDRVLTINEMNSLLETVKEHETRYPSYMPDFAIELALLTGMRVGEIAALKWQNIDEAGGVIHIVQSEHRLDYRNQKSELVIGLPKNGKTRTFPLTDELLQLLERISSLYGNDPDSFVFVRPDGTRYTGHDIGCAVARRASEAGIGKTSIHEIRRTVSSILNTVLPRRVVASLLGHSERVNGENYDYSTAENAEKKQAVEKVYSNVFKFSDYKNIHKKTGTA
jgi:integrase